MRQEGECISVLTVLGKKYMINEDAVRTVGQLKQQLRKVSGIEPQRQSLIINGTLCKDPSQQLFTYGPNPVCILASKVDGEAEQPPPNLQTRKSSYDKEHKDINNSNCRTFHITFEDFLSKKEIQLYRQQVESSYSQEAVQHLMSMMKIEQKLAIKAVRASCNDISDAIDFLTLEQEGQNYQQLSIENEPIKDPPKEQSFLIGYVEQQKLKDRLSTSKEAYILFVASQKEKSPIIYEMLLRNKTFMEKYLFQRKNSPSSYTPTTTNSRIKNNSSSIVSLRVSLQRADRDAMVSRLMSFGLPRIDAEWRLREAGNNILLAEQQLMQQQSQHEELIHMLPIITREYIVKAFFQSPAWEPFKAKLQRMHVIEARNLVVRRLKKHFPRIYSLMDNLWIIYPLLLGVPYSSIENVNLAGDMPRKRLRIRSPQQREKANRYYLNLVDRQAVNLFTNMGAEPSLAERALRNAFNLCYYASMQIIAGKIPVYVEAWAQTEQNEQKVIEVYMRSVLRGSICDKQEFDLHVAALAQSNPTVYECFVKYDGIFEAYRPLSFPNQQLMVKKRQRDQMKFILMRHRSIQAYYQWGYKALLLTQSRFK